MEHKDECAKEILDFLKVQYPDDYDAITGHYPEKEWNDEAASCFVTEIVKTFGAEEFLNGKPKENEKNMYLSG